MPRTLAVLGHSSVLLRVLCKPLSAFGVCKSMHSCSLQSLCKLGCSYIYVYNCVHMPVFMYTHVHVHAYLPASKYKGCDKADYKGGVRYTKNVVKQIVKVNYLLCVGQKPCMACFRS